MPGKSLPPDNMRWIASTRPKRPKRRHAREGFLWACHGQGLVAEFQIQESRVEPPAVGGSTCNGGSFHGPCPAGGWLRARSPSPKDHRQAEASSCRVSPMVPTRCDDSLFKRQNRTISAAPRSPPPPFFLPIRPPSKSKHRAPAKSFFPFPPGDGGGLCVSFWCLLPVEPLAAEERGHGKTPAGPRATHPPQTRPLTS